MPLGEPHHPAGNSPLAITRFQLPCVHPTQAGPRVPLRKPKNVPTAGTFESRSARSPVTCPRDTERTAAGPQVTTAPRPTTSAATSPEAELQPRQRRAPVSTSLLPAQDRPQRLSAPLTKLVGRHLPAPLGLPGPRPLSGHPCPLSAGMLSPAPAWGFLPNKGLAGPPPHPVSSAGLHSHPQPHPGAGTAPGPLHLAAKDTSSWKWPLQLRPPFSPQSIIRTHGQDGAGRRPGTDI